MSDTAVVSPGENVITPVITGHLRSTRPWVLLLGILGFVGMVFMLLGGAGMLMGSAIAPKEPAATAALAAMGVAYIVMALLYFFPAYFLVRYGAAIGRMLQGGGVSAMEQALGYQKSFWKFVGIVTLVSFALGVVGVIAAIAIPVWLQLHNSV